MACSISEVRAQASSAPHSTEKNMNARQTAIGLTLLTLTLAAGVPARAQAQVNGQIGSAPIDLQIFRPAADTKGYITLNGAQILAPLAVSFGMVTTGGWRPLNLDAGRTVNTNGQTQESLIRMNFVLINDSDCESTRLTSSHLV